MTQSDFESLLKPADNNIISVFFNLLRLLKVCSYPSGYGYWLKELELIEAL